MSVVNHAADVRLPCGKRSRDLSEHFGDVAEHPWAAHYELNVAEPVVGYLDSGREPIEAELGGALPWEEVLVTARALIDDHARRYGALRFERRGPPSSLAEPTGCLVPLRPSSGVL